MRKYPVFCTNEGMYTTHKVETIGDIQTIVCLSCGYEIKNKIINRQMKVPLWLYEKWMNNGGSKRWMLQKNK